MTLPQRTGSRLHPEGRETSTYWGENTMNKMNIMIHDEKLERFIKMT